MVTYDGLRVLMIAEDDSRCCFELIGPPSQPKNLRMRPRVVFFQAAFDFDAPGLRNTTQKSKNKEKHEFKKFVFFYR